MGKDISKIHCIFHFCDGGSCRKAGSEQVVREARAYLKNAGAWKKVHTIKTRCNGRCEDAPTWIVQEGNFWYKSLDPVKGIEIIQSHILKGKPLEEYLLFQPGWERVLSEKERLTEPSSFKWVNDPALGEVLLAKMQSSDQLIYPLFQFIFKNYGEIEIKLPTSSVFQLNILPLVEYSDTFDIWVNSPELEISLAIAPIPADASPELVERKVGIAELIVVPENNPTGVSSYGKAEATTEINKKGLRLRNRKGKELIQIWFKDKDNNIWNHILKNYLEINISEPLIKEYEQK